MLSSIVVVVVFGIRDQHQVPSESLRSRWGCVMDPCSGVEVWRRELKGLSTVGAEPDNQSSCGRGCGDCKCPVRSTYCRANRCRRASAEGAAELTPWGVPRCLNAQHRPCLSQRRPFYSFFFFFLCLPSVPSTACMYLDTTTTTTTATTLTAPDPDPSTSACHALRPPSVDLSSCLAVRTLALQIGIGISGPAPDRLQLPSSRSDPP